jgi:hypothetical protein
MATLSGAAIVLGVTAILVGLQMSSRFGTRASRTVTTRPIATLMGFAAIFGVAIPLWAAAEPWPWLDTTAIAIFAWVILSLGIAGSRVLAHLSPRWLAIHQVERVYPVPLMRSEEGLARIREAQSVLLEIADGAPEGDAGGHVVRRAIAYAALAGYRLSDESGDLFEILETLTGRAQSASNRGESPLSTAGILSLLGLVSEDVDISVGVLRQLSDLAQVALGQRREPVVRSLLDEAAGLVTDCLQAFLEPAAIRWITRQDPIDASDGLTLNVVGSRVGPGPDEPKVPTRPVGREEVFAWIDTAKPAKRRDAEELKALVPVRQDAEPQISAETVAVDVRTTMVEPPFGRESDVPSEEPIIVVDLGEFLSNGVTGQPRDAGAGEAEESPSARWQGTLATRRRQTDAYDLLEVSVETLVAAVAAPTPDDPGWPGGWRGSGAFASDMARLGSPALSLYRSGKYPPTDQTESAIESQVLRLARTQRSEAVNALPPDPIGWRVSETRLRPTAIKEATGVMRDLAIEAWRAGFARRTLLTIRRMIAVFTTVASLGDIGSLEDVAEELHLAVIRTAQWNDRTIAARQQARLLVLGLAPEFSTLGREAIRVQTDEVWEAIVGVLDTIGWSPRGSAAESAAEIYLHFLAGIGTSIDTPYFGRPWDLVSWGGHPTSLPEQLPDQVRLQLDHELQMSATLEEPRLAILTILALWRDAIASESVERSVALGVTLQERILSHGRRDFEPDELWSPTQSAMDRPPRFDQALVHWRAYDVALAASRWVDAYSNDTTPEPILPPVSTPDVDLWGMIASEGACSLVDERDYWGIEYGEDELVLVQEADQSRRLLRDCECRARSRINWGYGGSGPNDLAALLVDDALGPLAYCPSCFGTIGVAGSLIKCPICKDGMRPGLRGMQSACDWLTSRLSQTPRLHSSTEDAPSGAQWHIRRSELLDFLVAKVAERATDEDMDEAEQESE